MITSYLMWSYRPTGQLSPEEDQDQRRIRRICSLRRTWRFAPHVKIRKTGLFFILSRDSLLLKTGFSGFSLSGSHPYIQPTSFYPANIRLSGQHPAIRPTSGRTFRSGQRSGFFNGRTSGFGRRVDLCLRLNTGATWSWNHNDLYYKAELILL